MASVAGSVPYMVASVGWVGDLVPLLAFLLLHCSPLVAGWVAASAEALALIRCPSLNLK